MTALSIEQAIHQRLKDCSGRCENIIQKGGRYEGDIICPNEHGKHATTFKGKVVLTPHYLSKTKSGIKDIRMWCYKCHKNSEIKKYNTKSKPRKLKLDKHQIDLFNQ